MDLSKNLKAFLSNLPIGKLTGHQMFAAIAVYQAQGSASKEINTHSISQNWLKSILTKKYNPSFYNRAQQAGWLNPVKKGIFTVSKDGIQHIKDLTTVETISELTKKTNLIIFNESQTHTFDKFLRNIFATAKNKVLIADAWVDETIFDNVLDSIPKITTINLLYKEKRDAFDSRMARFKIEYKKFTVKRHRNLHDRFLVIDKTGYVIGPSIKDAAKKSPALVVKLDEKSSSLLEKFFEDLWE